jgi:hypothetical protein
MVAGKTTYGMRWRGEGLFSSIKRIFGEGVRATFRKGMLSEVRMKINGCYTMLVTRPGVA